MISYWKSKRIVVTGGSGFIGSNIVNYLNSVDCHPYVVNSREYDLTKENDVVELFKDQNPNILIHLAGRVGSNLANKEKPAEYFYQNIIMGTFIMHYAHKYGVEKMAALLPGCSYPERAPIPLKESYLWEGFPQQESASYGIAKRVLEVQAQAYSRQFGFVCMIAIPGNVYGPYDNFDLYKGHIVPALTRKFVEAVENGTNEVNVWGSGNAIRDYIYVGDVVRGLLQMVEQSDQPTVVNLSREVEIRVNEVVDTLIELTGFQGNVVYDTSKPEGQERRLFDVTKAKDELGFVAKVDLREGLLRTIKWYRAHRDVMVNGRVVNEN